MQRKEQHAENDVSNSNTSTVPHNPSRNLGPRITLKGSARAVNPNTAVLARPTPRPTPRPAASRPLSQVLSGSAGSKTILGFERGSGAPPYFVRLAREAASYPDLVALSPPGFDMPDQSAPALPPPDPRSQPPSPVPAGDAFAGSPQPPPPPPLPLFYAEKPAQPASPQHWEPAPAPPPRWDPPAPYPPPVPARVLYPPPALPAWQQEPWELAPPPPSPPPPPPPPAAAAYSPVQWGYSVPSPPPPPLAAVPVWAGQPAAVYVGGPQPPRWG